MNNRVETLLSEISIHKTGPGKDDLELSPEPIELLEEHEVRRLTSDLLKGFEMEAVYKFSEPDEYNGNNPKILIEDFFYHDKRFHELSEHLAREWTRLQSDFNDSIELIICHFHDIYLNGEVSPGIGIFVIRSKENFLQIYRNGSHVSLGFSEGVNLKKITECVLILPGSDCTSSRLFFKKNGYDSSDRFFTQQFLKAKPTQNNYLNTSYHLNLLKAYVDEQMTGEGSLEKIDRLNRSKEYFNNHEHYDRKEFESAIFENPEHIASFERFRNQYALDKEIPIIDEFDISSNAVKKHFPRIRSVIKLDKNFHIYVHGNRQNIIRGYDPDRGKYFYQIFFDEEH
jgi:hypothetical protein